MVPSIISSNCEGHGTISDAPFYVPWQRVLRGCTHSRLACAFAASRLASRSALWQLAPGFGSNADEALRGERQACFEGLELELGKNRSASADRFFVAEVAHTARFQPLRGKVVPSSVERGASLHLMWQDIDLGRL